MSWLYCERLSGTPAANYLDAARMAGANHQLSLDKVTHSSLTHGLTRGLTYTLMHTHPPLTHSYAITNSFTRILHSDLSTLAHHAQSLAHTHQGRGCGCGVGEGTWLSKWGEEGTLMPTHRQLWTYALVWSPRNVEVRLSLEP